MIAQPLTDLFTALKTTLTVPAVTALAPGGVWNTLPQSPTYPALRLWGRAKPVGPIAAHTVWEADVEVWILSTYAGDAEALEIAEEVAKLLDQPLVVANWRAVVVSLEDLFLAGDEEIAAVVVKQWVLAFHVHLEQA